MYALKSFIDNFLTSGIKDRSNHILIQRVIFINFFILLGTSILLGFGIIHLLLGNFRQGIFNVIAFGFGFFVIVFLRLSKNVNLSTDIILTSTLVILLFYLYNTGLRNRAITWYFVYPGLVFYLKGKKKGVYWLLPLYLFTGISLLLDYFKVLLIPYDPVTVLLYFIPLTMVTGILYLYEKLREEREGFIEQQNLELINKTEQINVELSEKMNAIEKQKTTLNHFSNAVQILTSLISASSTRLYEKAQETKVLSVKLAQKLNLDFNLIMDIESAAILKDIGMIGKIENLIYSKKDLLSQEKKLVKSHIDKSINMIENIAGMNSVKIIIAQHHERYDGSGYPKGLIGKEIFIGARLIGLVDDFIDYLHDNRFQGLDKKNKILKILEDEKGKKYDPVITDIFISLLEEEKILYNVNEDEIYEEDTENSLLIKIPSDINLEAPVAAKIMDKIKITGLSSADAFLINYCVREVMRNAIIHGNKYDKEKQVEIKIEIEKINEKQFKLIVSIKDKGEGLDITSHKKFVASREELFSIYERLKNLNLELSYEDDKIFNQIMNDLNSFKNKNYFDFNVFMQFESEEMSGGVGLLYVETAFDNVEYNKIIKNNNVVGFEVVLEKILKTK